MKVGFDFLTLHLSHIIVHAKTYRCSSLHETAVAKFHTWHVNISRACDLFHSGLISKIGLSEL